MARSLLTLAVLTVLNWIFLGIFVVKVECAETFTSMKNKPKCIAHRGFSSKYPENTMIAFKEALKLSVDGLEMDLRLTADNCIIIMHDETLDRTTNGTGKIREKNWVGYIDQLNAGGQPIPLLSEILQLIEDAANDNLTVIFDIKDDNDIQILNVLAEQLDGKFSNLIELGLWNAEFTTKAIELLPFYRKSRIAPYWLGSIDNIQNYSVYHYAMFSPFVKIIHANNQSVYCWTVDDATRMKHLAAIEVDGIITNCPDVCMDIFSSTK